MWTKVEAAETTISVLETFLDQKIREKLFWIYVIMNDILKFLSLRVISKKYYDTQKSAYNTDKIYWKEIAVWFNATLLGEEIASIQPCCPGPQPK